jgi:hypothetical protein
MRVPREVERLIAEGASLSGDDAQALERRLEQKPDDLEARARLLGYHRERWRKVRQGETLRQMLERFHEERDDSFLEFRTRNALWLAANAPRAPLAAHPHLHLHVSDDAYAEASAIWRRHASAEPPDATLLAHAIAFFWQPNEPFSGELLARAEQLFPGDPRWPSFRRERRAHELCHHYGLAQIEVPGDKRKVATEADLAEIEQLLPHLDRQSGLVPRLREAASELALALGQIKRARRHAEEMLVSNAGNAGDPSRRHGDAVHDGHLLLGRIALHADDVARARAHLVLAGQAGATGFVPMFGPDLRLAQELLARGERDVVVRYLTLARAFWDREQVDEWIPQLRAGRIPDKLRSR